MVDFLTEVELKSILENISGEDLKEFNKGEMQSLIKLYLIEEKGNRAYDVKKEIENLIKNRLQPIDEVDEYIHKLVSSTKINYEHRIIFAKLLNNLTISIYFLPGNNIEVSVNNLIVEHKHKLRNISVNSLEKLIQLILILSSIHLHEINTLPKRFAKKKLRALGISSKYYKHWGDDSEIECSLCNILSPKSRNSLFKNFFIK